MSSNALRRQRMAGCTFVYLWTVFLGDGKGLRKMRKAVDRQIQFNAKVSKGHCFCFREFLFSITVLKLKVLYTDGFF